MCDALPVNDELPGMPPRSAPRKGSIAWTIAELRRFRELSRKHSGLTNPMVCSVVLSVSSQRVYQLMDAGVLSSVEIFGKRYVPCDDLEAFAALERSSGTRYVDAQLA
jgi:hypothetical protein